MSAGTPSRKPLPTINISATPITFNPIHSRQLLPTQTPESRHYIQTFDTYLLRQTSKMCTLFEPSKGMQPTGDITVEAATTSSGKVVLEVTGDQELKRTMLGLKVARLSRLARRLVSDVSLRASRMTAVLLRR